MVKITLGVEGMRCAMCEAHINDAIRARFKVKKVTSSRGKKETVIISEADLSEGELRGVIGEMGYELISFCSEPYEKRGFFQKSK